MATVTLKDSYGRTLAKTDDKKEVKIIGTKTQRKIGGTDYTRVVAKTEAETPEEETVEVGYVEDTVLEQYYEETVSIPTNFAGLETVMVPTRLRDQLFDITEVVEGDGYVEVTAVHMFYRQRQNSTLFDPGLTTKYSGAAACRNVMTNALFDQGFNVASDSTDQILGNRLDFARKNIVEAFLDPESGICARYGLSIIRDNDVFYCLKSVGYDRGFIVQDGKNMLGVERTENIENLITRVAPTGRDANGDLVWLNNNGLKYVDSTHINDYVSPKLEIYDTGLRIGEDGVTAENIQAKLLEAGQKRFSVDEVDIPEVTMTIRFVSLGDTEEYAQYRGLDKVYLYDILHIKDTQRGYSYSAQVIGVQHNVLTGMLESVTIGTPKKWDGVRKIGSWQVPDFNGGKIRPGSVRAGSFENNAVRNNDLASAAVDERHFSQSGQNKIDALSLERIRVENTSADGILNTRFLVDEGHIEMVVDTTGQNPKIKAAEIVLSINRELEQSEIKISANVVDISGIITVINNDQGRTVKISADSVFIDANTSISSLFSGSGGSREFDVSRLKATDLTVTGQSISVGGNSAAWHDTTVVTGITYYTGAGQQSFIVSGGSTCTATFVTSVTKDTKTLHYLGKSPT